MRKITIILAILVIGAMSASAQLPAKPFTLYADGGITMPNGDASVAWNSGWHFGAAIGFPIAPMIQVMPKIEYHSLGGALDGLGFSGGDQTVWMIGADSRFNLSAPALPVKPFLLGGIGMAIGKNEAIMALATEVLPESTNSNLYWNIGAGIELGSMFVQARYVSIAMDGGSANYIPITLGLKF